MVRLWEARFRGLIQDTRSYWTAWAVMGVSWSRSTYLPNRYGCLRFTDLRIAVVCTLLMHTIQCRRQDRESTNVDALVSHWQYRSRDSLFYLVERQFCCVEMGGGHVFLEQYSLGEQAITGGRRQLWPNLINRTDSPLFLCKTCSMRTTINACAVYPPHVHAVNAYSPPSRRREKHTAQLPFVDHPFKRLLCCTCERDCPR
jgi:hypothetical protein